MIYKIFSVILSLFFFLFSIDMMGSAFLHLSKSTAHSLVYATSNPFTGLFIGLLITALIQSSSTTTSMAVAAVASGSVNLSTAIPIVMGANIGTTLTSTIVSMGFVTGRKEFRKALSAATAHDFFNIIVAFVLFPLEYYYSLLSKLALSVSGFFTLSERVETSTASNQIFDGFITTPWAESITMWINNEFITLLISFILLFTSIKLISSLIYKFLIDESREKLDNYFFNSIFKSFSLGTILTATIQSSSITTSLMVPLVATNRISLKNAFPFIMGANIGTTLTAFLAALFKSDAALTLAIVHFLFFFRLVPAGISRCGWRKNLATSL